VVKQRLQPPARQRTALTIDVSGWFGEGGRGGRPIAVVDFTVRHGKIVEIDVHADPEPLRQLDLAVLDG
jgi:hypothetical protein